MLSAAAPFRHFCTHPAGNPAEFQDTSDHHTFKKMLPRDERRFKAADLDGDQTATREEFTAFLHPEEFEHMKEIVVLVRSFKSLSWGRTRAKSVRSLVPSCKERAFFSLTGIGKLTLTGSGEQEYLSTQ